MQSIHASVRGTDRDGDVQRVDLVYPAGGTILQKTSPQKGLITHWHPMLGKTDGKEKGAAEDEMVIASLIQWM